MNGPRVHRRAARRRLLTGGRERPLHPSRPLAHTLERVRHRTPLWRWLLGWLVVAVGILGIFLPLLPALVLIPAGVVLIGRRARTVRWARTRMKLLLRHAETWRGAFGRIGAWLREKERRTAKFLRDRRLGPWERPRRA